MPVLPSYRNQSVDSGVFIVNLEHIPHLVCTVNFEQIIADWDVSNIMKKYVKNKIKFLTQIDICRFAFY